MRDCGRGTDFINQFLNQNKKLVIVEVEHPTTIQAKRRIHFYERLGFKFNEYLYTQPSYHRSGETIDLIITTYPRLITKEEYDKYITIIKREVYNK